MFYYRPLKQTRNWTAKLKFSF